MIRICQCLDHADIPRMLHATNQRKQVEAEWKQAIMELHRCGMSYRRIAPLAGVSFQRIAQIVAEMA